jgi:hypothetical protein
LKASVHLEPFITPLNHSKVERAIDAIWRLATITLSELARVDDDLAQDSFSISRSYS